VRFFFGLKFATSLLASLAGGKMKTDNVGIASVANLLSMSALSMSALSRS
jgi:hypothetical protein